MKQIYPDFYPAFRCLAGDCPDTCCKDWEIVVDDEAMAFYRTIPGELGEKLKTAFCKQDGDTCFRLDAQRKCVLLTPEGLCPLQAAYGEKALCRICASHPRFLEEYGATQEITLSISCPAAAKLLLDHPAPITFLTSETDAPVLSISCLFPYLPEQTPEHFRALCSLYSKEVEHSEDNLELLYRSIRRGAFRTNTLFSLL